MLKNLVRFLVQKYPKMSSKTERKTGESFPLVALWGGCGCPWSPKQPSNQEMYPQAAFKEPQNRW